MDFVSKVRSLLFNIPSRLFKAFLPRSSSVKVLSHVWLFETPWTAAQQASLSITNSQSLHKLRSIKSVMSSKHLILLCPLLLLPSIFPSIGVFSNESLHIRWPKYWSFSFSISSSISLDFYNKCHKLGGLSYRLLLPVLEALESRIKVATDLSNDFLVCQWPSSCYALTWWRDRSSLLCIFLWGH